jgi:hypothetical protein
MSNSPSRRQAALLKGTILVSMISASASDLRNIDNNTNSEINLKPQLWKFLSKGNDEEIHGNMIISENWKFVLDKMLSTGPNTINRVYRSKNFKTYVGNQRIILPLLHTILNGTSRGSCIDKALYKLYTIIGKTNRASNVLNQEVLKLWPSHYEVSTIRQIKHFDYAKRLHTPVIIETDKKDIFTLITTAAMHRHIKGKTNRLKHKNDVLCRFYNMITSNQNQIKFQKRLARNFQQKVRERVIFTNQNKKRQKLV